MPAFAATPSPHPAFYRTRTRATTPYAPAPHPPPPAPHHPLPTTTPCSAAQASSSEDPLSADADVIFIVQKLRTVHPTISVYAEVLHEASMALLSPIMPFSGFGDVSPFLMAPFTAGSVSGAGLQ